MDIEKGSEWEILSEQSHVIIDVSDICDKSTQTDIIYEHKIEKNTRNINSFNAYQYMKLQIIRLKIIIFIGCILGLISFIATIWNIL